MRGMIHIYTGEGKGKTTAAFGLAARATGHGKRVLFIQFLKGGGPDSGEILAGRRQLLHMEIMRFKHVHPIFDPSVDPKALADKVMEDFAQAKRLVQQGDFDMVVLDEVINCSAQGLLALEPLLDLLETKPEPMELILTGRGADPSLIEKADYVTEMKNIKHPAQTQKTPARKGVEY